jgi:hypothetical protein
MLGRLRSIFSWWIFAMDLGSFFALRIAQSIFPREGAFSGCPKFAQSDAFKPTAKELAVHPALFLEQIKKPRPARGRQCCPRDLDTGAKPLIHE